jgi:hypothetical protein
MTPCACCGAPYHPATGGLHYVEFTDREVPWCGACERDFVKWFVRHAKGRHRKLKVNGKTVIIKFYDCVGPPREGDET